jgi:hypothetical protein
MPADRKSGSGFVLSSSKGQQTFNRGLGHAKRTVIDAILSSAAGADLQHHN